MIVASRGQDDCFADCWVLTDFAVPSVWQNSFRHRTSYGESLIDKSDHSLRGRNHFHCGRDDGLRRCEDCLNHPDNNLDSAEHGLPEREGFHDGCDYFPGHAEDSLRLCDNGQRRSEDCQRRSEDCQRRFDDCQRRSLSHWKHRVSSNGRF